MKTLLSSLNKKVDLVLECDFLNDEISTFRKFKFILPKTHPNLNMMIKIVATFRVFFKLNFVPIVIFLKTFQKCLSNYYFSKLASEF